MRVISSVLAVVASLPLLAEAQFFPKAVGDPGADLVYTPLAPCRLIDTRGFGAPIQGGAFAPNERRPYAPAGLCAIPTTGVAALNVSLTTQNLTPNSGGYLAMLAPGAPLTTTVDIFNLGSIWSAASALVPTGSAGQFDALVAGANAHLVVDVMGYYRAPTLGGGLRIEQGALAPNMIGGSSANVVTAGVSGATIGGGGSTATGIPLNSIATQLCSGDCGNRVTDTGGTIGGGFENQAGDDAGTSGDVVAPTVGGGMANTASGTYSIVGGGFGNVASSTWATVGGGSGNLASGTYSTVAGGQSNAAIGTRATVAGGVNARASGDYSFAAGRFPRTQTAAGVVHQGAFIWADSSNFFFYSTAANEFSARATGGVRFVTGIDGSGNPTAGVTVSAGGGSWASLSDVNAKADFAPVDSRSVLAKVAALPIASWRYRTQDASIRHIGPTAQDFHAAFGVGDSDRTITTVDADGVALAAIQALEALVREKDARIDRLEKTLDALARKVEALSR